MKYVCMYQGRRYRGLITKANGGHNLPTLDEIGLCIVYENLGKEVALPTLTSITPLR